MNERIGFAPGQNVNGFVIKQLIYNSSLTLTYIAEKNSRVYVLKEPFPIEYVEFVFRDSKGLLQSSDPVLEQKLRMDIQEVLKAEQDCYSKINSAFVHKFGNNCQYIFPLEIQSVKDSIGSIAIIDTEFGSTLDAWVTSLNESDNDIETNIKKMCDAFISILDAIKVIHQTGQILHCDLKPNNIYLVSTMGAKILDFGSAIRLDLANKFTEIKSSSYPFTPPEISMYEMESDNAFKVIEISDMIGINSDLYSVGYMLYYSILRISGVDPDSEKYRKNIGKGIVESSIPEYLKIPVINCLARALYNERLYRQAVQIGKSSGMYFLQDDPYMAFQDAIRELKDIIDLKGIHPAIIKKSARNYYENNVALYLSEDGGFIEEMLPEIVEIKE